MNDFLRDAIYYVEGKIDHIAFEERIEKDDALYKWFQSIIPKGKMIKYLDYTLVWEGGEPYNYDLIKVAEKPFDVRLLMAVECSPGSPKGTVYYHYTLQKEIFRLLMEAFPNIKISRDKKLEDDYYISLDACPSYIGGKEIAEANIIGKIIDSIPRTLSKTARQKECRRKLKEIFHIEGKRYPNWIQEPEWPLYEGRPMKYIRTEKHNSEVRMHYFVDVETGVEKAVFDAY